MTSLPDIFCGVAFNADPNDPVAVPTWSDLSVQTRAFDTSRGRNYELDQNTGGGNVRWRDVNEYLNPSNPSSPYSPHVLPYRQITFQVMVPVLGTGNLLNSNAFIAYGIDPSFESYTAPGPAPSWITAVGAVAPTVTTTNPQQGTKDLTYTVVGTTTVQGIGVTIPCIPGRQYTASAYLRQTSASTQTIGIVGVLNGTSTSTTGAYVRLAVTFTATQPTHTLQLATTGTAVAGTVNVDAIQHEAGSSVSAFTTTGPFIRPVWTGYVERWAGSWQSGGFEGYTQAPLVDVLAILAGQPLNTELVNAYLATVPDWYYPLWEDTGASSFADATANNRPPLLFVSSKYGAGVLPQSGTTPGIIGDPQGVGVQFTPDANNPSSVTQEATIIGTGPSGNTPSAVVPPTIGSAWSASIAAWVNVTGAFDQAVVNLFSTGGGFTYWQPLALVLFSGRAVAELENVPIPGAFVASANSLINVDDGVPHFLVGTVTQTNGGNTVVSIYVDGVLAATTTVTTASIGGMIGRSSTDLQVGGLDDIIGNGLTVQGIVTQVGIWNRALSAGEVTTLWTAGNTGASGENSGTRIARYLTGAYAGPTAIDVGMSTMGPSTVVRRLSLLDACQDVAATENGDFFGAADRTPTFLSRSRRYTTQNAAYVFGENTAGGELPYLGDIAFELDPHYIANNVQVSKANGVVVVRSDATSAKRYFAKDLQLTTNPLSDLEVYDAANWLLAIRKDPQLRCARVTFDPASNPTLWVMCLSIEKGTRVTVKRRAKAANAGAGLTMAVDFWVDAITHKVDRDAGTWFTTLQLTPVFNIAGVAAPWILDDANRSVLDSTTIPGW